MRSFASGVSRVALRTVAIAIVLLVAFGARVAHLAVVRHGVCEHGQLTHVHAPTASSEAGNSEGARDGHSAARSGGEASEDAHEHCAANAVNHRIVAIAPCIAAATLSALLGPADLAAGVEQRPIAPLRLAPKASPPSA